MQNVIIPNFGETLRVLESSDAPAKRMLEVERDGAQTLVRINSSSLSLIQSCPRKSYYTLKEGWRAKSGSPPLLFGSAVHKALEVFYSHSREKRLDNAMPPHFDDHAMTIAHGHAAPDDHFLYKAVAAFVAAAEPLRMLPDTDKRSLSSGIWMLGHYFKTYLNDAYVIHRDAAGPITERSFCVPLLDLGDLKVELHGQIDFMLRNEATGELICGDHKTSSQMGNEFMNRLKPNHQYTGYLFGAREVFKLNCENFMVNGLMVKARPLTARGGPPTFLRQITRRTPEDFAEFNDVVEEAVRSFLRWDSRNVWPLGSVDACAMWGSCTYLDVCSAPNELRNNILEAKYSKGNT